VIVPVHYEGWQHFKQSGEDLRKTFSALGLHLACFCSWNKVVHVADRGKTAI
jgi:hypothetical protein